MAKGPTTMAKDYYQILGVSRDASTKDIKKAYRRLARQNHPDVNRDDPAAEQRFKDIQVAYDVLSDDDKRQKYDQYGADFEQYQQFEGFGGFNPGGGGVRFETGDVDLGDLFGGLFGRRGRQPGGGAFFGGGFQQPQGQPGPDVEVALPVSLEEVEQGGTRDLSLTIEDICAACGGLGQRGNGQVCPTCHGRGRVPRQQSLKGLKLPRGVEHEAVIRVRGKGGKGAGGPDGDLLVKVQLREHPFFRRDGLDLECEVPVSLAEAALGAEIQVPTLRGHRPLTIPAGTQGGQRFRIKGYGLPNRKGEQGNLTVRTRVQVPRQLSAEEQALVRKLADRDGDPRAELWRPEDS